MNTRTVYRFEHATNKDLGLWYMKDGSESGLVHKLNLSSKEMPMGRDDSHYVAPSNFELMEKINELIDEVNRLKEKFGEE